MRSGLSWEKAELHWLKKFLRSLRSPKLSKLAVLDINARDLYGRHWSVTKKRVPGAATRDAAVYLPGRNVLLCSKAAVYAAMRGVSEIEIGILRSNPFGDASEAFLKGFSENLSRALSKKIAIRAPFRHLTKREVLKRGRGLRLDLTFSCLQPRGLKACGKCNKCGETINQR